MAKQQSNLLIAGAGLSGLTLAVECAKRPFFQDKSIILIDRDDKTRNDRTWCFWAQPEEKLPPIVHKTWEKCMFYGSGFEKPLGIEPFRYHMVRGLDFYNWAKTELTQYPNVQSITSNILDLDAQNGIVKTELGDFQGQWVFNSAFIPGHLRAKGLGFSTVPNDAAPLSMKRSTYLLQHFKGWVVKTPTPKFDPDAVTFMDYRLEQHGETRFVYVLPLSETRALVEFTVFSPSLCQAAEYDKALQLYLAEILKIKEFRVEEEEFGVIPMTDLPLPVNGEGRTIHIGTPGGFVKASSGYAFLRTQRKIKAFLDDWGKNGKPNPGLMRSSMGFRALDSIMLRVLKEGTVSGKDFFSMLFQKLPAPLVFRFLDEDASLTEVLRVLSAPPTWPFFKTAIKQLPFLIKI